MTVLGSPSKGHNTIPYDANGNTTVENAAGQRTTYSWDIENHLTKVELAAGTVKTITLDGDGKRRRIEDSAGLRNLIWDLENILAETDSGNSTLAAYTLAPEVYGELVSQRWSGLTSFHHYDALGSTDRMTDSSANPVNSYLYRAFGEQTALSASRPNRFTWVGRLGCAQRRLLEAIACLKRPQPPLSYEASCEVGCPLPPRGFSRNEPKPRFPPQAARHHSGLVLR